MLLFSHPLLYFTNPNKVFRESRSELISRSLVLAMPRQPFIQLIFLEETFQQHVILLAAVREDLDDAGDEDEQHGEGGEILPADEPVETRPRASHQLYVVCKPTHNQTIHTSYSSTELTREQTVLISVVVTNQAPHFRVFK